MRSTMLGLVLCLASSTAPANDTAPDARELNTQERAALERVALGRARRSIRERVLSIPIGDRTLGEWQPATAPPGRTLRMRLHELPRSRWPRVYSDGQVEVDVVFEPQSLRPTLRAVVHDNPELNKLAKTEDILGTTQWWATGTASPDDLTATSLKPAGWEDVTIEGATLARADAVAAARRELLNRVALLSTRDGDVEDFLSTSPNVRRRFAAAIAEHATVRTEVEPDQLCIARATIEASDVMRLLNRVHREAEVGDAYPLADLRAMAVTLRDQQYSAVGVAEPRSDERLATGAEARDLNAPAWHDEVYRATLSVTPPPSDVEAAQYARGRGLAHIHDVVLERKLREGLTVREFLRGRDWLRVDLATALAGTRIELLPQTEEEQAAEQFRVRVELPLERVWRLIRRAAKIERVDSATQPAATQASAG